MRRAPFLALVRRRAVTAARVAAALVLTAAAGPAAAAATSTPAEERAADHGTLLVLNKSDATVSFLDPRTGEQLALVPTGVGPHEADVSPDGTLAVICDYGEQQPGGNTLTVIDVATREVLRTIDLGENRRPHGIDFLDATHVLITTEATERAVLVDVISGKTVRTMPTEQPASHMVVLGPRGRMAYIANIAGGSVSVVDVEAGELVKVVRTAGGCEGIDLSPDGKQVWTSNRAANSITVIDTTTLEATATFPSGGQFPIRIKFTPDGKHALVSNAESGTVVAIDTTTHQIVHTIPMLEEESEEAGTYLFGGGNGPMPIGILIEPDGTRAYVANTNADTVTVLDLVEWKIAGRLATGRQPDGMAWAPAR